MTPSELAATTHSDLDDISLGSARSPWQSEAGLADGTQHADSATEHAHAGSGLPHLEPYIDRLPSRIKFEDASASCPLGVSQVSMSFWSIPHVSFFQSESLVGSACGLAPLPGMDQAPREVATDHIGENSTQGTLAVVQGGVRGGGSLTFQTMPKDSEDTPPEDFEFDGPINPAKHFAKWCSSPKHSVGHLHCATVPSRGTIPTAGTQSAQTNPVDWPQSGEMSPSQQVIYSGLSSPRSPPAPAWSAGTALHSMRKCRPCAYAWSAAGCTKGTDCIYCHERHENMKPSRPCKGRRQHYRKLVGRIGAAYAATTAASAAASGIAVRRPPAF